MTKKIIKKEKSVPSNLSYKPVFVSRECHQKVRLISSLEGQSMGEWMEWAINKAYEASMINRGRKGKLVVS